MFGKTAMGERDPERLSAKSGRTSEEGVPGPDATEIRGPGLSPPSGGIKKNSISGRPLARLQAPE